MLILATEPISIGVKILKWLINRRTFILNYSNVQQVGPTLESDTPCKKSDTLRGSKLLTLYYHIIYTFTTIFS